MPTTSQVKAGLDDISTIIRNARAAMARAKAQITASKNELASLPTTYSAVIAEIDAYVPTGSFEELAKDEKAKLQTEFTALRNAAASAETSLASITEF